MTRSVIIDDDSVNISLLSGLLNTYCPEISIVQTATNVEEGLKAILNHNPEILFLDIEIHDKTGFDVLNLVGETNMQVILVTAYERYALQAFKFSVVDYILKPIKIEELIVAVQNCKKRLENQVSVLPKHLHKNDSLAIHNKGEVEFIRHSEIVHLDGLNGCTEVHLVGNKKLVTSRSLKEIEAQLPNDLFLRVHNSHIIHIGKVAKLLKQKNGILIMTNKQEIPISEGRRKVVNELLDL